MHQSFVTTGPHPQRRAGIMTFQLSVPCYQHHPQGTNWKSKLLFALPFSIENLPWVRILSKFPLHCGDDQKVIAPHVIVRPHFRTTTPTPNPFNQHISSPCTLLLILAIRLKKKISLFCIRTACKIYLKSKSRFLAFTKWCSYISATS